MGARGVECDDGSCPMVNPMRKPAGLLLVLAITIPTYVSASTPHKVVIRGGDLPVLSYSGWETSILIS